MKTLNIDIETFSSVNLAKSGVYKYAESEDFEVLLFAYSLDGASTKIVDIKNGEKLPLEIEEALRSDEVIKWAFNAQFERICLSRFLNFPKGSYLNPTSWRCTMVWSAYLGLPLSLEGVGKVLGLDKQKLTEGKVLIKYFCVPCFPTKTNVYRIRNLHHHDKVKWENFKMYNMRDVDVERAIGEKLAKFPVPDFIWKEYKLDQEINDRGIMVDLDFVQRAIELDEKIKNKLMIKLQELTELENPNSVMQLKTWIAEQGLEVESLDKKSVTTLVKETKGEVASALGLRLQLSKSSVKKYQAMRDYACKDNRCRGMFRFLGANRTGRYSSVGIQLQNLPRNYISELEEVRTIIKNNDGDILEVLYDDVPNLLSQLIRTAFIPKKDTQFYVADFSAIEARVIAWLAGESWREEVFKKGGDIYCMSASQMFGVPVVKHGINGELRQKGKIAELACIAEGEKVLTDVGLVPIEKVTTRMKVWDGINFVKHEGVIYRGEREVITYDGLTATPDHLVWIEGRPFPIPFKDVSKYGLWIEQTGLDARTVQYGQLRHIFLNEQYEVIKGYARVYDIRNAGPHNRFTVSDKLVHNCGYGGSVGALKNMGAVEMGLSEEELKPLVTSWREANPNIVALWWAVDRAAKDAVKMKTVTKTHGIEFECKSGLLRIKLPSGRKLTYVKPKIEMNKFGSEAITYEGTGTAKKWERIESYGPKFVENIVQAIARDLLVYALINLSDFDIVAHVHDEIIIEAPKDTKLEEICSIMSKVPPWGRGLILNADGYTCEFYKKD